MVYNDGEFDANTSRATLNAIDFNNIIPNIDRTRFFSKNLVYKYFIYK